MQPPLSKDPIAEAQRNWTRRGWTEEAAPMAAVTAIMRVQQLFLGRAQKVLKPYQLTFARYEVLALLNFSREHRLPMNKISSLLQVHPTSVTNAADRLESAGLVERHPHSADRRALLLVLTEKGRQVAEEATGALNRDLFQQTGLTPDEVDDLNRIFTRFRQAAGDFD